uniref:Polyketide synthase n=1 Tax=Pyxidicoccus sp. MCy9557 TaxID=2012863 RepID=A0A1Z2TJP1_9BACT|nr:polyketide synthase [Pyxidicoccus sp. MCy9557]
MDRHSLQRRDILARLARREISREEAMRLLKEAPVPAAPVSAPAPRASSGPRDIAIIGMSGQFPGAKDLSRFWENLVEGRDSVTLVPKERWDGEAFYDADPRRPGRSTCKWGGFLTDADVFDREFFGISPREALLMDPQQRLFLQEAWKALEDAGYSDTALSERACGVYVGYGSSDYRLAMRERGMEPEGYAMGGTSSAILAARISYFLNLRGPSLSVDTACSASLVAIHLACESLWSGTIRMALAGGVCVYTTPDTHVLSSKMNMLSVDGRCKTFDDSANGFVPAEGVGVVVLKPLEDALADGDSIHAVLKATGINQDGRTNGITAPSAPSQQALETSVYTRFGIDPSTLGYVEAHGTGTKLGDPIEIQALTGAFSRFTDRKQFCAIGSVKTNIGHTIAAAGVAGVIKAALCMKHRRIPPSLHFKKPNRHIDFARTPFFVPTEARDWPTEDGRPRRAAVSSFGFSGTNAHLVLEEAPAREEGRSRPAHLALFSAKSEAGLRRVLERFLAWLPQGASERSLEDITYTLQVGRSHFPVRCGFVARNADELASMLRAALRGEPVEGHRVVNLETHPAEWDAGRQERGEALLRETAVLSEDAVASCRRNLLELSELYVQGYTLPWDALHQGHGRLRVSLPTYPFEGARFWLPGSHPTPVDGEAPARTPEAPAVQAASAAPSGAAAARDTAAQTVRAAPAASSGEAARYTEARSSSREERVPSVVLSSAAPATRAPVPTSEGASARLQAELAKLAAQVLKLDPSELDLRKPLSVYGFDSILLTELVGKLKEAHGVELDATVFYEHPTLLSFAQHLHGLLPESSRQRYAAEAMPPAAVPSSRPEAVMAGPGARASEMASAGAASHASGPLDSPGRVATEVASDRAAPPTSLTPGATSAPAVIPPRQPADEDAIAIVGMAGRFPGSPEVDAFWEHLLRGDDLVTEVPADRWDWRARFGDPARDWDKTRVKWGGFMSDVDKFDALFFGISPKEAEVMDPQQRLFLETAWKAIEDSGHRTSELWGSRTGVFVGMAATDYSSLLTREGAAFVPQSVTGTARSILPNRLSYLLNLRGPSEAMDTACSSALVALHRAVKALRGGECDLALVGGVHVMLDADLFVIADKGGLLSPDGRCKTFDAKANGYVRGEGVAVVVLKPLRRALADRDSILGVIRGAAVNHSGRSTSLTAPNPVAQAELMVQAWSEAKVDPATVTYVEAMGTGTALGDPIELNALKKAFAELYQRWGHAPARTPHCGLGSVKTNIGHLEPASGMASLIKVLMAMRHGTLPATLHVEEVNPRIQLEGSPFYLNREVRPWARLEDAQGRPLPRRAGVNSFGYGGVNAHVVLEEYLPTPEPVVPSTREEGVLVLSARDAQRLRAYATALRDALSARASSRGPAHDAPPAELRAGLARLCAELLGVAEAEVLADDSSVEMLLQRGVIERLVERIEATWDVTLLPSELVGVDSLQALVSLVARRTGAGTSAATRTSVSGGLAASDFRSVLYTLQVGRDALEERLALVVSDADEALAGLDAYLRGEDIPGRLFLGHRKRSAERLRGLGARAEAPAIQEHLRQRRAAPLAELWALGAEVEWSTWYGDAPPRRVSLPAYPFARTRHWPEGTKAQEAPRAVVPALHPLLGRNTSTLEGTRFTTTLSGEEFFVRDHVIQGRRVLPGAASLEMARAGAVLAMSRPGVRGLGQVSWRRPVVVDTPRELSLHLRNADGGVAFEVTMAGDQGALEHARGRLLVDETRPAAGAIDLQALLRRCTDRKPGAWWYELLRRGGSDYGPDLRVIEDLARDGHESVARLRLPERLRASREEFVLHPSLVDGAIQSLAGLLRLDTATEPVQYVPATLEALEVFGALPPECYACIEEDTARPGASGERTFHLQLADAEGRVAVRMRGLSVRPLERALRPAARPAATAFYCQRTWEESRARASDDVSRSEGPLLVLGLDLETLDRVRAGLEALGMKDPDVRLVMPGTRFERVRPEVFTLDPRREEDFEGLLNALGDGTVPSRLLHLWSEAPAGSGDEALEQQLLLGFYSLASLCRAMAARRPKRKVQGLYAHASGRDGSEPLHAAVGGLLRTVRLESPALALRSVELATRERERPSLTERQSLECLLRELVSADTQDVEVQYREGRRYVSSLGVLREKV